MTVEGRTKESKSSTDFLVVWEGALNMTARQKSFLDTDLPSNDAMQCDTMIR